MRVAYLGHSSFLFRSRKGLTVLTDPYDDTLGLRLPQKQADFTLISHDHWDHNHLSGVPGRTRVVQGSGTHAVHEDLTVRAVLADHDAEGGRRFGMVNLFSFAMDGVCVGFLSDLGHVLSLQQISELGPVDLLLIPVGGHYTIDGPTAQEVMGQFPSARMVVPMHYMRAGLNRHDFPISGVEPFLQGLKHVRHERSGEIDVDPSRWPPDRQILVLTPQY